MNIKRYNLLLLVVVLSFCNICSYAAVNPTQEMKNLISVSSNNGWGKRIVNIHSSSGWNNDTENAYNILLGKDNVLSRSDKWFSTSTSTPWVIFSLADIYKIEKFEFRDGRWFEKETGVTNVSEYTVYVSTTGTQDGDWTEVIHETGVGDMDVKSKILENPVEARYIKFVTKGGGDTGEKIWIYGVDIYGTLSKKIDRGELISVGANVISDCSHASVRETPANLVDGLANPYGGPWATSKSDQGIPAWVILDLGNGYEIDKFAILDGNDWTTGYRVYVSNDNLSFNSSEWVLAADQIFDQTQQRKEIELSTTVSGRYVKLEIPTDRQLGWTRIQEFEVYGKNIPTHLAENNSNETNSLYVYPNPTNNSRIIQLNKSGVLKIYTAEGRLMCERKIEQPNLNFSIKGISAGTYFLNLISGNKTSKATLIVR